MANQLKMAKIGSILTLRERGWSCRRIARELRVDRETVSRYLRLAGACTAAKPAMRSPARTHMPPLRSPALPSAQSLEVRLQEATGNGLSHAEFLELILQNELPAAPILITSTRYIRVFPGRPASPMAMG